MKKLAVLFMCMISVFTSNVSARSSEEFKTGYVKNVINKLQAFDIVRNCESKWNETDLIKRRDVLEMAYIVKTGQREFDYYDGYEDLQASKEYTYEHSAAYTRFIGIADFNGFADVESYSYDDYLTHTLFEYGILTGKYNDKGELIADLDEYITYQETCAVIGRLFLTELIYNGEAFPEMDSEDYYLEVLNSKGITNSKTDIYSVNIDRTMLKEKIPAHEFLCLIYKSLYTPTMMGDWDMVQGYYYINNFVPRGELEIREDMIGITD